MFLWSSYWRGSSHRGLLRNGAGLDTPVPPRAREPSQSGGLEGGGHSLPLPCRMGHPHSRDKDHILPAGNARAGRTVLSAPFPSCFLPLGQLPAPGSWARSSRMWEGGVAPAAPAPRSRAGCGWGTLAGRAPLAAVGPPPLSSLIVGPWALQLCGQKPARPGLPRPGDGYLVIM